MTSDPASEVIRGRKFKKCIFLHSEGSTPSGTLKETLRPIEAAEAVEAVEAVEVVEAVEAAEAVEVVEAVEAV